MPPRVEVFRIDSSELNDAIKNYGNAGPEYVKALTRSTNWVGRRANTVTTRILSQVMGVTQRDLKPALQIIEATWTDISFYIVGRGRPLSLRIFGARQIRAGVSARPWGLRRTFRGAFIVNSLGGSVYERTRGKVTMTKGRYKGKKRERIRKMWGPSVPNELMNDAVVVAFRGVMQREFGKRLEHEIAFALKKIGKRAAS